ncbi:transporter [uncultured Novosphingobium sp.]|uniref:transporter n=1 Tax=uncultured Novosphingobium sp. TaxID=292277 RepID=UPI002587F73A|nr:transporter [uncultured Novosphingobium sp.]
MPYRHLSLALAFLMALTAPSVSYAVDRDAGDYDPAKPGTNLALVYLQHAERDEQDVNTDVAIFRLVGYVQIAGLTVAPQVLVPVIAQRGLGDRASLGRNTGLGDIILAAPVWLVNRPQTNTYFGMTPYLYIPTGDYDPNRAFNAGEDRWKLNLQAAGTVRVAPKLAWDAGADITFYDKTGKSFAEGRMTQKVGYQVQSSLRYLVSNRFDLRGGVSHAEGGTGRRTRWSTGASPRPSSCQATCA